MTSLADREWKEFLLKDIFEIRATSSSIDRNKLTGRSGATPYITRTDLNNGFDSFIGEQPKYKYDEGNVITVGLDTQTAFYQPVAFYTGQNIQVLSNEYIDRYTALFIVPRLKELMKKFNWGGNGATLTRLKRSNVLLPIDEAGKPDWKFMSAYMREHENAMISQYEKYLKILKATTKKTINEPIHLVEFRIGDLFELFQGKSKGLNHLQESGKGVNYLGATNQNNGVLTQVSPEPKQVQKGNCIAFIRNGEGSMGYAIYKAEDFIATSDITVGYNDNLNRYIGQYIVSVADQVRGKYNFGYKRSGARLAKETLLLPATEDGKPDWNYMEAIERERERVDDRRQTLDHEVAWQEYYLSDIFDIKAGKRLTKADMRIGKRPFIGATDNNNGITNFVSNTNASLDEDILGVNYNGSVVETFYHPYESIFSDDVKRFSLKDHEGNKYIYLFLKATILKQKEKYAYGYKFNETRMSKQKITLPAKQNGEPDFEYMADYARNIETDQLSRYVTYLKTSIV